MTHIINPYRFAAAAPSVAFSRTYQVAGDANYALSFDFGSSVDVGAASTNRAVIVFIAAIYGDNAWSVSMNGGAPDFSSQIASDCFVACRNIGTGTTISLSLSGQSDNAYLMVGVVTGTTGSVVDSATANSSVEQQAITIDVPSGGITVCGAMSNLPTTDPNLSTTWTNATRVGTDYTNDTDNRRMTWATTTTPGVNTTINYRHRTPGNGGSGLAMFGLSFQP